ncbi:hypothetical protein BD289DRAFT_487099 [Coniella lustricola]|uniref:Cytokinesis regulator n=1 Tax=Coniella lustricola TaxID=2025994 RepID=A0A2T2ZSV7_9PEZI|nr:hypothetical protein BD289DRAFT_487099 [Coniella lustricola]
MNTLRIKECAPVEDDVENWDDDDFLIDGDDLALRNASSSVSAAPHRRDSLSSHRSLRSERDSVHGDDDRQVHLPGNDERSTLSAIAIAASAGIPIPRNVPSSALQGTIRKLGGRKVKKILQEDWSDDLMFADGTDSLRMRAQDPSRFPEVLRHVSSSSSQLSSLKASQASLSMSDMQGFSSASAIKTPARGLAPPINLDRYRDTDDDNDLFGDGMETIKVSKTRPSIKPLSLVTKITTSPTPLRIVGEDDFEKDLEFPSDGTLKLSARRDIPRTPLSANEEFDWGEGSLGTRYAGTRRDGRSNRSSSASAFSPSISSTITAESEDEAQFDGIEIPNGPLDLSARLRRQRQDQSPEHVIEEEEEEEEEEPAAAQPKFACQDGDGADFFADLDIGDGSVFAAGKVRFHTNVQLKNPRTTSPVRPKAAVSLTFTNKPAPAVSRLPRPSSIHERSLTQMALEPVSESGGPIATRNLRRSQSRLGHMSQSSTSSIGSNTTPITPSGQGSMFSSPSTPRRREVGKQQSAASLRQEATTTNAQLLRLKRSLPVMKPNISPGRSTTARPPSSTDVGPRSAASRPKTPVDRARLSMCEAPTAQGRKPFVPAGNTSLSSNVNAKGRGSLRRQDSDLSVETRSATRTVSRTMARSPSPSKQQRDRNLEKLAKAGIRLPLSLPKRPRQFGSGHELDAFDDLPTSAKTESEFVKQPKQAGQQYPTQFRNKAMHHISPASSTPHPALHSPVRFDTQPRFARDTASSRIARETNLAHRVPSSGPLVPLTSQRVAQLSTRSNLHLPHPPQGTIRSKKHSRKPVQTKPHLISNLNSNNESKMVNGMLYNPETYQWEGNDHALNAFDTPAYAPASSPSTASVPTYGVRDKENATPRPALITNISATKGVQVVGGMVFDPQNMCWLKLGPQSAQSEITDPLDAFAAIEDEDDVFKDIPDLEDNTADTTELGRTNEVKDDWLIGEEFDVGPEFIRRQREEEERWRKKCERWLGLGNRDREDWRWHIRSVVNEAAEQ